MLCIYIVSLGVSILCYWVYGFTDGVSRHSRHLWSRTDNWIVTVIMCPECYVCLQLVFLYYVLGNFLCCVLDYFVFIGLYKTHGSWVCHRHQLWTLTVDNSAVVLW